MSRVIVRMWTADGYHKDVAMLDEKQVRLHQQGMECKHRHILGVSNPGAVRVVVDPKHFPEAVEFEVIVEDK